MIDIETKTDTLLTLLLGYNDIKELCDTSEEYRSIFNSDILSLVQAVCLFSTCRLIKEFGKSTNEDIFDEFSKGFYSLFNDNETIKEVFDEETFANYICISSQLYIKTILDNHLNNREKNIVINANDLYCLSKEYLSNIKKDIGGLSVYIVTRALSSIM